MCAKSLASFRSRTYCGDDVSLDQEGNFMALISDSVY